ncbi:hypothetical protein G6F40_015563 [Rhizopus arrhizus]|nr:hypothetical protein G6F40_015563 [Rhizopus arrhizus]
MATSGDGTARHVYGGAAADQLGHLCQENQDGQRVDEAGDDRARDEAHQRAELEHAGQHLQQAGQDAGREQGLQAVVRDQVDHHQCHRAGRPWGRRRRWRRRSRAGRPGAGNAATSPRCRHP